MRSSVLGKSFIALVMAVMAISTVGLTPARAVTAAPTLSAVDAPFVRTLDLEVTFTPAAGTALLIAGYRLSNTATVDGTGMLVDGASATVTEVWPLAAGADGPRTVYGQAVDTNGDWTAVTSLNVVVDRSGINAIAIDADPGAPMTVEGIQTVVPDTEAFVGRLIADGLTVAASVWTVRIGDPTASLLPNTTYPIGDEVTSPFLEVARDHQPLCTAKDGSFSVGDLTKTTDLQIVEIDFRVTCDGSPAVVAGSVRYGGNTGYKALGQSAATLTFGTAGNSLVGQTTGAESVTLTNLGTLSVLLGTAAKTGANAADFAITGDTCSGTNLAAAASCTVTLTATPAAKGNRAAALTFTDTTPRTGRSIPLQTAAFQSTTTALAVQTAIPTGPTTATVTVTITPANDGGTLTVQKDGVTLGGGTSQVLTGPSRRVYTFTTPVTQGHHEFTAAFEGTAAFYLDSTATPVAIDLAPTPDTTAPTVSTPALAIGPGTAIGGLRATWSGADDVAVDHYDVAWSVDGGAWSVATTSATGVLDKVVSPGHTYQVRVRAVDGAAHMSAWRSSNKLIVSSASEASGAVKYSTGWGTYSAASYWGGKVRSATRAGASATYTFTGRSVSWAGVVGPTRGTARVYINGVYVKTVNLFAASVGTRRIVFTQTWSTSATRTLTIKVNGGGTHPRVDVDGFVTTR